MAGTTSTKGKNEPTTQDDVDEMFGKDAPGASENDFADVDDLLNTVQEDDSEGWVPAERGEGIAGIVIKIGETRSDFAGKGEDPMCPTVTIQTRDGDKFRIIGYGSVLKREIADADPKIGDLFAVKYWGEKPIKKGPFAGKNYKHFSVAVRRANS